MARMECMNEYWILNVLIDNSVACVDYKVSNERKVRLKMVNINMICNR